MKTLMTYSYTIEGAKTSLSQLDIPLEDTIVSAIVHCRHRSKCAGDKILVISIIGIGTVTMKQGRVVDTTLPNSYLH